MRTYLSSLCLSVMAVIFLKAAGLADLDKSWRLLLFAVSAHVILIVKDFPRRE